MNIQTLENTSNMINISVHYIEGSNNIVLVSSSKVNSNLPIKDLFFFQNLLFLWTPIIGFI